MCRGCSSTLEYMRDKCYGRMEMGSANVFQNACVMSEGFRHRYNAYRKAGIVIAPIRQRFAPRLLVRYLRLLSIIALEPSRLGLPSR